MAADDELEVQIAARVDTRGRVEFGVVPLGGFVDNPLLPRARFMSRQNVNERRWLYSSEVAVSSEADGTPGMMAGATTVVVRIAARGVDGNRVEFALQVKGLDGTWGERLLPRARFFPLSTPVGRWLRSSALTIIAPGDGPDDPGRGETCRVGMEVERGGFCRYPSYTAEFSVNVQGTGVFEATRSQTAIDEAFTIGGVAHRFAAENAGRVWLITHVGPSTSLPACVVGGEVEYGSFCEHAATGDIFSVSEGGVGSYDGQRSGRLIDVDVRSQDRTGTFRASNDRSAGVWRIESTLAVDGDGVEPPILMEVACAPSTVSVDETVTCRAQTEGGAVESYRWSGGGSPANGSDETFTTQFDATGSYAILLEVSNDGGRDVRSAIVSVGERLQVPEVDQLTCDPSSPKVGDSITCTAEVSGGAVETFSWSDGENKSEGPLPSFTTRFSQSGRATILLVVSNEAGSDSAVTTVTVTERLDAPSVNGITCTPSAPQTGDTVSCRATLGGGKPSTYSWTGGGSPATGRQSTFTTTFASAGNRTITLVVSNAAGSDQRVASIVVQLAPPKVEQIECSPSPLPRRANLVCKAVLSGGAVAQHDWWSISDDGTVYRTGPSEEYNRPTSTWTANSRWDGWVTIYLTVTNSSGSHSSQVIISAAG